MAHSIHTALSDFPNFTEYFWPLISCHHFPIYGFASHLWFILHMLSQPQFRISLSCSRPTWVNTRLVTWDCALFKASHIDQALEGTGEEKLLSPVTMF